MASNKGNSNVKKKGNSKASNKSNVKKSTNVSKNVSSKVSSNVSSSTKNNSMLLDYKAIIIIIIAFVLVVLALCRISGIIDVSDYSKSYLLSNKIVSKLDDSNLSYVKGQDMSFVLITSLNSESEYNLEKGLEKEIVNNNLQDNFYVYVYKDISELSLFGLASDSKMPTIVYYKNNALIDKVERIDDKMIEAGDFAKLLDIYELSSDDE